MKPQLPCPRCGSDDISYHPSPCLCADKYTNPCWSYPQCNRCGYTNGNASANSDGVAWMADGTTFVPGVSSLSTEITEEVQERIDRYNSLKVTSA